MYDTLYKWYEAQQTLARAKEEEKALRDQVVGQFFAEHENGTERVDIPGDAQLVCTRSLSYAIDEAALDAALEGVPKTKRDKLVRWKPSLDKRTLDSLSAKARAAFEECLVAKVGSPSIKIILPEPAADGDA